MGLKAIDNVFAVFSYVAGIHSKWQPVNSEERACFLPCGKADTAASSVLQRVRGKAVLQLDFRLSSVEAHPRGLESATFSTFATLGLIYTKHESFVKLTWNFVANRPFGNLSTLNEG